MSLELKVGYHSQSTTAGVQVGRVGPRGLAGVISTETGGAVTIYDNTAASGTILFSKTLTAGEVVDFGYIIAAKNGLFLVVAAGTVVVLYT